MDASKYRVNRVIGVADFPKIAPGDVCTVSVLNSVFYCTAVEERERNHTKVIHGYTIRDRTVFNVRLTMDGEYSTPTVEMFRDDGLY